MNLWQQKILVLGPCNAKSVPALVTCLCTHIADEDVTQAFVFIKLIYTEDQRCRPCVLQHSLFSWHCTCDTFFNTPWYTPQR